MQQYRPHPIYYLLMAAMLFLIVLLGRGLRDGVILGDLLFLGVGIGAFLYFAGALTTVVTVTDTAVTVHHPLGKLLRRSTGQAGQQILFQQLIQVELTGRLLPSLTLLYHPRATNTFVDTETIQHITLPMVLQQEELQTALEAVIPQH